MSLAAYTTPNAPCPIGCGSRQYRAMRLGVRAVSGGEATVVSAELLFESRWSSSGLRVAALAFFEPRFHIIVALIDALIGVGFQRSARKEACASSCQGGQGRVSDVQVLATHRPCRFTESEQLVLHRKTTLSTAPPALASSDWERTETFLQVRRWERRWCERVCYLS